MSRRNNDSSSKAKDEASGAIPFACAAQGALVGGPVGALVGLGFGFAVKHYFSDNK